MTKKQAARTAGSVTDLCDALGVARQLYYKWGKYPPQKWQEIIISTWPDAGLRVTGVK